MPKKKKKNKKKGTTPRLSPENYFKTKVRKLPIAECYITESWSDAGLANILVSRKHVSGNRTFAVFLTDLKCLGIKEVDYQFNRSELEFEELLSDVRSAGGIPCEYNLVHNVIYGALEFAGDYGFAPHKKWEIGRYILEEDDEQVPLIDIEFGEEGMPCYISGPNDDQKTQTKIIRTLERTAGPGQYHFFRHLDEFDSFHEGNDKYPDEVPFNDDEFEEEFDSEFEDEFGEEFEGEDSAFLPGEVTEILEGKRTPSLKQIFILLSAQYCVINKEPAMDITSSNERIIIVEQKKGWPGMIDIPHLEETGKLMEELEKDRDNEEHLKKINRHISKYGKDPLTLELLYVKKLEMNGVPDDKIVQTMKDRFPDYLAFRFNHAYALVELGRLEEAWKYLGEALTLDKGFPDRDLRFSPIEYSSFHNAMCIYFTVKEEFEKAISYAGEIIEDAENGDSMALEAVKALCAALQNAIMEK